LPFAIKYVFWTGLVHHVSLRILNGVQKKDAETIPPSRPCKPKPEIAPRPRRIGKTKAYPESATIDPIFKPHALWVASLDRDQRVVTLLNLMSCTVCRAFIQTNIDILVQTIKRPGLDKEMSCPVSFPFTLRTRSFLARIYFLFFRVSPVPGELAIRGEMHASRY